MSSASKIIQAAAGNAAGGPLGVEDVFSTYLYEGTGSALTITNGIDLDGEGGLVWLKAREPITNGGSQGFHVLYDTNRGATKGLYSHLTNAEATRSGGLTSFNSNGFSLGTFGYEVGASDKTTDFASWTFRKAPKFFDVVTYTGTGSATTISHNLGSVPGCIMVKRTDTSGDWQVYHRANTANPETDYLVLNSNAATADSNTRWNDTAPTDSVFTVGTEATVNASGGTYVAYLFAHDDDGEGIVNCGSYSGDGGAGTTTIDLGWQPQWILVKCSSNVDNWFIIDAERGWDIPTNDRVLLPNTSNAESTANYLDLTADGFKTTTSTNVNVSGRTYVFMAIRSES